MWILFEIGLCFNHPTKWKVALLLKSPLNKWINKTSQSSLKTSQLSFFSVTQLMISQQRCQKNFYNLFTLKGSRISHSKIGLFGIRVILNWRHLQNRKCMGRISLNSPYLPEDRSSKKNSVVINPLPGSFINQEKGTLIIGKRQKSIPPPNKLPQAIIPPMVFC